MPKISKKIISVFLAAIMIAACFAPAVSAKSAEKPCDCEYSPTIIVPGLFQSPTHLYNDDGTLALTSDGEPYAHPFFLDSTADIVKTALKKLFLPLFLSLLNQSDKQGKLASRNGRRHSS